MQHHNHNNNNHKRMSWVTAAFVAAAMILCVRGADYCEGVPSGYLCVKGVTDKYYECNGPFYEGWRDCGAGSQCVRVGHFATNPCSVVTTTTSTDTPQTQSETTSAKPSSTRTQGTSSEQSGMWAVWLGVGVGAGALACGAAVAAVLLVRRRSTRRSHQKQLDTPSTQSSTASTPSPTTAEGTSAL